MIACKRCLKNTSEADKESLYREVTTTFELYKFINPAIEKQLKQVADSCFDKEAPYLVFYLFQQDTLYVQLPDVNPEDGAPFNAFLGTYNNDYFNIEIDSSYFTSFTACVKIGKRLCLLDDHPDPKIFRNTGRRIVDRHITHDYECPCLEEERYLLLNEEGWVQRVYPDAVFIPDEPIETILVEIPDEQPQFPGGEDSLSQWIAERVDWPDSITTTIADFIVELDGRVTEVIAPPSVVEPNERAFIENLRPFLSNMPRWTPGKEKGKTVRSQSVTWLHRPNYFQKNIQMSAKTNIHFESIDSIEMYYLCDLYYFDLKYIKTIETITFNYDDFRKNGSFSITDIAIVSSILQKIKSAFFDNQPTKGKNSNEITSDMPVVGITCYSRGKKVYSKRICHEIDYIFSPEYLDLLEELKILSKKDQ